jgi:hypothetical protein
MNLLLYIFILCVNIPIGFRGQTGYSLSVQQKVSQTAQAAIRTRKYLL